MKEIKCSTDDWTVADPHCRNSDRVTLGMVRLQFRLGILKIQLTPYHWLTSMTGFPETGRFVEKFTNRSSSLSDVDNMRFLLGHGYEMRKHVQKVELKIKISAAHFKKG